MRRNPFSDIVDIPDAGATDRTQMPDVDTEFVTLIAPDSNDGSIYVGGADVTNSSGANEGYELEPGKTVGLRVDNLQAIFVAADNAGDDVKYLLGQAELTAKTTRARYNSSAPTLLDGDFSDLQLDSSGNLNVALSAATGEVSVTPADVSHASSGALAASLVVKASAGKLFSIRVTNESASQQYIQLHNSTSLPADTTVPLETFRIAAESNISITFERGLVMSTGIVVCNSSTVDQKTIGSADCWISADYE